MKICYFGHQAHLWSGSSKFFEEVIEDLGHVTYFRPNTISVENDLRIALETDYDLYVFFQYDFLAYPFLAAGKNVIVIPMVDGSSGYGHSHWKYLRRARFVSFSPTLHRFLRLQGMSSFCITYWPESSTYIKPESESIYYWPRGHHSYISTAKILFAMENYPQMKLLVRTTSDLRSGLDYSRVRDSRIELVEIGNQAQHFDQIQKSTIFIAPRPSEGIGHSFLEAMSLGRAVIGKNFPTMSEYISNYKNGVFFSNSNRPIKRGLDWSEIGLVAHRRVIKGRTEYLGRIAPLKNYILKPTQLCKQSKVKDINRLIKLSCAIMRREYLPGNSTLSLRNYCNFQRMLKI